MHKIKNKLQRNINVSKFKFIYFLVFCCLLFILSLCYTISGGRTSGDSSTLPLPIGEGLGVGLGLSTTTYRLLIVGDIFLDRHIDELTQKDNAKIKKENLNRNLYSYPFQGLGSLHRENYDAWIGNLECPVTEEQSTKYEKENYLKFSCKKEYLPELKKYFDIVSLANNHTNNMGGEKGLLETRKHLDEAGIKYFGDFDSSKSEEICKLIEIEQLPRLSASQKSTPPKEGELQVQKIPIAFCGFHGVFKLPTDKELAIIKKYSDKYFTIVMPHQGEEYKFTANTYQRLIYRKMIDLGADVVIGAHPHVIQNVEEYKGVNNEHLSPNGGKGKKIFYSLGNFIFDQSWAKTREHMVVDLELTVNNSTTTKAKYSVKYTPIFTHAGLDFITKKK